MPLSTEDDHIHPVNKDKKKEIQYVPFLERKCVPITNETTDIPWCSVTVL